MVTKQDERDQLVSAAMAAGQAAAAAHAATMGGVGALETLKRKRLALASQRSGSEEHFDQMAEVSAELARAQVEQQRLSWRERVAGELAAAARQAAADFDAQEQAQAEHEANAFKRRVLDAMYAR